MTSVTTGTQSGENIPVNQSSGVDEATKRRLIKKYFEPFPMWAVVVAAIAALVGLGSLGSSVITGIILLLVAAGAGYFAFKSIQDKPSDQQMDAWLKEDLAALDTVSLNKGGLDESQTVGESVKLYGPCLNVSAATARYKVGKDKIVRYTPVHVGVMHFVKDQLFWYGTDFDRTTGKALNESTDEYFYKDVVSVSTKAQSGTVQLTKKRSLQYTGAESFTLTTSGGTSISLTLNEPSVAQALKGDRMQASEADKSVQKVRSMLREKKAA